MYIDEALQKVIENLNDILVPGRDAGKMQKAKDDIGEVIAAVRMKRMQESAEEKKHED